MKRTWLFLFTISLICFINAACFAQEDASVIPQEFPRLILSNHFDSNEGDFFYRFPKLDPMFDPLELSFFPGNNSYDSGWSLLERKTIPGLYNQMVMLDRSASETVMHGTAVEKQYGLSDDFYLYMTLFVSNIYPSDKGSCYVYFSDSLMKNVQTTHGILFDPGSGVYRTKNHPGAYYGTSHRVYDMTLLKVLSPQDHQPLSDTVRTSYAASYYDVQSDEHFAADWNQMKSLYAKQGNSDIKAYRIEIIRRSGISDIFVNGKRIVRMADFITSTDPSGKEAANSVSWSYGPILYKDGISVSCAIGDFYIYGR